MGEYFIIECKKFKDKQHHTKRPMFFFVFVFLLLLFTLYLATGDISMGLGINCLQYFFKGNNICPRQLCLARKSAIVSNLRFISRTNFILS